MQRVLRGATVVDGTGAPGQAADVLVDGDRIADVAEPGGLTPTAGAEEVDLRGLVLAPGFVDIHTHYDAQVLWDPDLTPSSWHGVTTVVIGNCGFGIAPTRPEHRGTVARTLENVEGMSVAALEAGIPWTFETFPEYLDAVEAQPLRLNVAALIGHTPLRLYVLGDEAAERAATDEEVARMRALVAEAVRAGAVGFATSKSPTHSGAEGRPVPSRVAETEEIFEVARALADVGRGIVQVTPGPGMFMREMGSLSQQIGRPVSWTALLTGIAGPGSAPKLVDATQEAGGEVWPQIACRPLVMSTTLLDPFPLASLPAFEEVLAVPHDRRAGVYRDPAWRDRARPQIAHGILFKSMSKASVQETERFPELVGVPLSELAESRGVDPFDLMVDLALDEDLRTRFRMVLANDDEEELTILLKDRRCVLGLSDAGAHASQLCDACFSTHLLGYWARERGVLSLEEAVWRLTGHPAQVFRLPGRGRIAPGMAADLVAFDGATVAAGPLERVWDLPAGADRLVVPSVGVEHVWVNGAPVRRDGKDLAVDGSAPGRLLRGGEG
jgi:N-acyl-D-amino-acid deacylase